MSSDSEDRRPLRSVLVANRGEIAARIERTVHDMGLSSVAVFADEDRHEHFVTDADLAIGLGAGGARAYLDEDAVVRAALASGADAVHPGYGFLSERASFAEAVLDAGLIWVGPSPLAMRTMADKQAAKRAAAEAGVPVLSGCALEGDDETAWSDAVHQAGLEYPLIAKAVSGGGGRGMRVVVDASQLGAQVRSARHEAATNFGDATVFAERYLPRTHHVEVQVLGDAHGTVLHLGERDCSVQRRHQKLLEETPSPAVDDDLRQQMADAAVSLAAAIGYTGVGTVEFLVPAASATFPREFYFCEMNTRLQVEHPVTEAVWGIDLVRCQLQVAAGKPLGLIRADLAPSGHAIEARLVAEDPAAGWLASPGPVTVFDTPSMPGVRWDVGVHAGGEVSASFDPLIAKVIAHGSSRHEARRRLSRALRSLRCVGPTTNRELLLGMLDDPAFAAGTATTALLDDADASELVRSGSPDAQQVALHALAAVLAEVARHRGDDQHWSFAPPRWSNVPRTAQRTTLGCSTGEVVITHRPLAVGRREPDLRWEVAVVIDDEPVLSGAGRLTGTSELDGASELTGSIELENTDGLTTATAVHVVRTESHSWVHSAAGQTRFEHPRPMGEGADADAVSTDPVAPVPARVVSVEVEPGQVIEAGATLVVLEAMKVEHRIRSVADATVAAVLVAAGDSVDANQPLVRLEESP